MKKVWTAKEIEFIQLISQDILSLSAPIATDNSEPDTELGDLVKSDEPTAEELAVEKDRHTFLVSLVKRLEPREQTVIMMRYGLITGEYKTLDEVGQRFGVTRERIRQIEVKALRKLKYELTRKHIKMEDL